MYLEFNLRLFFHLLFTKADVLCAIDLDTILPVYFVSVIRGKKRVYDAHELFTEQKEIVTRPAIHRLWLAVERFAVPKFHLGYTVNQFIIDELHRRYDVQYKMVRNLPTLKKTVYLKPTRKTIFYQGAVNEGRCFETLIPAMLQVDAELVICGDGNFIEQARQLVQQHSLQNKVKFMGYIAPQELALLTPTAYIAVMLFENKGLNQYYSLANRFFDYIMAGVPQVCVDYPEYKVINDAFSIALMVSDTSTNTIAEALNKLLKDDVLHNTIRQQCFAAREQLNWSTEEKVLLEFYKSLR